MTKDNAIDVMKNVHTKIEADIPFKIVEQCYDIEKKFLFEKDPNKSLNMLKQIVETYVDEQAK